MFKSIRSIRQLAVFHDFAPSGESLPDFAERNLLYGWNYSGKTTFSRIFRAFETGKLHPDFPEARFRLGLSEGTSVTERDLGGVPFPVRVFNSDFVHENIKWEEGVDPILLLGEESIALQERLATIENLLRRREAFIRAVEARQDSLTKALDDAATAAARRVREEVGKTPFNRTPHLQDIVDSLGGDHHAAILSEEEANTAFAKLNAEPRNKVALLPALPEPQDIQDSTVELLAKTPRQELVARLKDDREIEAWVGSGLPLHENRMTCLFCTQDLPDTLLETLGKHFSKEFRRLQEDLEVLLSRVNNFQLGASPPPKSEFYPDLHTEYERAKVQWDTKVTAYRDALDDLKAQLEQKRSDPSTRMSATRPMTAGLLAGLSSTRNQFNDLTRKHNQRCENFRSAREAAEQTLIRHIAASYVRDHQYHETRATIMDLAERRNRWRARVEELEAEHSSLENMLSEEARGADAINNYLRQYFGTDEIRVDVTETGTYKLRRGGGHPARNLSEGEKTAIAFSYFLVSLEDRELNADLPAVYIDDPISSLDANHLFNTFSTIKRLGDRCRQIFVSTHNFGFFRLMKGDSFFAEVVKRKRRARWYLIRRHDSRESRIMDLPAVLRKFNSEYHYLFQLAVSFRDNPEGNQNLLGLMPNVLRRMLEIYSSFRIPNTAMNLRQRLERLEPDPVVQNRIYKFVNHGSHSDSIDLAVEFPRSTECLDVVESVLEMIKEDDPQHHAGMLAICESD